MTLLGYGAPADAVAPSSQRGHAHPTMLGRVTLKGDAMAPADPRDELHDAALAEDIALLGAVMEAAAHQPELTQADVDGALGLPEPDSATRRTRRPATGRSDPARQPQSAHPR